MNWKRLFSGKKTATSEPRYPLTYFYPKKDITVRELAYVVVHKSGFGALQDGIHITHEQWDKMPSSVKRHFTQIAPNDEWMP